VKVSRLDLLAFGPFTGHRLDFGATSASLHIVYGPNEAGKSSCLRALRAWLYGIPVQNSDDFIHPYTSMRIGGVIEAENGEKLEFIRRKGVSKTLRASDNVQLVDPAELSRMLGNVDQTTFEQRFAIDYQELIKGGGQIANGTGQLSEILFAAGAGITDLRQVQKGLEDELQKLFKSRGTNASINGALECLKKSKQQMKELSLATADWEKHRSWLDLAEGRLRDTTERLNDVRCQFNRCERLRQALPLAKKLRFTLELLQDVAQAALLPVDFAERRSQAVNRHQDAEHRLREAQQEVSRLEQLLRDTRAPDKILKYQTTITDLHTKLGGYQKAAKDRPKLLAELRSHQSQAETHLGTLGWESSVEKARSFHLSRPQRKRISELVSEWKVAVSEKEGLQKTKGKLLKSIKKIESSFRQTAELFDSQELKRVHNRGLRSADAEPKLQQLRLELKSLEQELADKLACMPHYQGTVDRLALLRIPLSETVEGFGRSWRDLDEQIARQQEKISAMSKRMGMLERSIEKLRLEHDVPTEADLLRARDHRSTGWVLLQKVLSGEIPVASQNSSVVQFVSQWPGCQDLSQAFEKSLLHSDSIADRLRREAQRVSDLSNWTAERNEMIQQLELESMHLSQNENQRSSLQREWFETWQPAGIVPLSPDEMLAWMRVREELVAKYRVSKQCELQIMQLEQEVADCFSDIQSCLSELNQPSLKLGISLREAIEQCAVLIHSSDSAQQQYQLRAQELERLREELAETVDACRQSDLKFSLWTQQWKEAAGWLHLPEDTVPDVAHELLQTTDELKRHIDSLEDLTRRLTGIDRDAQEFSAGVLHLLAEVAPNLELPVEQAVVELHQRLQEAVTTKSKVQQWQEQLGTERFKKDQAAADLILWQNEIETLCAMANCSAVEDLTISERRSSQRIRYEEDVRQLQESLLNLAGFESLTEFLAGLHSTGEDELASRHIALAEQLTELEKTKSDAAAEYGARKSELERMDGSAKAAEAQEDVQHCLATIRLEAEQYIRFRLADRLLRQAIERFREANQGPVLDRAGQLFAELTLGSFSALRADFDQGGIPVLVGVRSDGLTTTGIHGMSTGTCDQLYLSLRLAMLESYARQHHATPFIVDDILIQFDDDRSRVALKLLCDLSDHTQVIFFTHHRRIVELARQHLPQDRLAVHYLSRN